MHSCSRIVAKQWCSHLERCAHCHIYIYIYLCKYIMSVDCSVPGKGQKSEVVSLCISQMSASKIAGVSKMVVAIQSEVNLSWSQKASMLAPEITSMCEQFMKGSQSESGVQAFIATILKLRVYAIMEQFVEGHAPWLCMSILSSTQLIVLIVFQDTYVHVYTWHV